MVFDLVDFSPSVKTESHRGFLHEGFLVASPTTLFLFFSPNTVRLSQDYERFGIAL